jgi:hypothetical protein
VAGVVGGERSALGEVGEVVGDAEERRAEGFFRRKLDGEFEAADGLVGGVAVFDMERAVGFVVSGGVGGGDGLGRSEAGKAGFGDGDGAGGCGGCGAGRG